MNVGTVIGIGYVVDTLPPEIVATHPDIVSGYARRPMTSDRRRGSAAVVMPAAPPRSPTARGRTATGCRSFGGAGRGLSGAVATRSASSAPTSPKRWS